jgi:hypothetical protein
MADEVILLYVHVRSPYASLGLVRIKQAAWLADMGAGGSEFWQVTLRRDAEHSQIENPETQSSVHNQPLASPSVPMSPTSIATPPASPSPIISIADAPAVPVERGALVSWVVGILALSVIATLIWRRRR